jgi:hypothetical protein
MANFLDDVLDNVGKVQSGANGFTAGAHTVHIGIAEPTKDSKDRDIIKVIVLGDNGEEGESTLWLHTEGGCKMAVTKVLGILVHNVPEDKKATISDFGKRVFANVKTPADTKDGLAKILNEKLMGKEAFIFSEPREGYKTSKYVDLWHYDQSARRPADHDNVIDNLDGEQVEVPNDLFA